MSLEEFLTEWHNDSPTVLVHTSGSTGKPKPMLVEKRRMEASARITCQFLGLHEGDTALLCMPLDYIAGKMMVVRALTCGLRLVSVEPKGCPAWEGPVDFAAMVPLQVWNLLQQAPERLRQIRHLIIGGGAINDELATALKDLPNHIWSTYGMTETLSHIALRRLNGPDRSDWYTPFEGVEVSLNAENCLVINAPVVHDGLLVTNDIAELSTQQFRILGRKDNVICSGGIKIQIEEVERLLHPHLHEPYIITKAPDTRLGEQVVLLTESTDIDAVRHCCEQVLPKYWQPRRYLHVDHLPLTETGKPARAEAERLATF
ncbi:MAG: AMP-binding protein [Prevotella sp.]|nr:AMP-binding protein [Prevotella sp.]